MITTHSSARLLETSCGDKISEWPRDVHSVATRRCDEQGILRYSASSPKAVAVAFVHQQPVRSRTVGTQRHSIPAQISRRVPKGASTPREAIWSITLTADTKADSSSSGPAPARGGVGRAPRINCVRSTHDSADNLLSSRNPEIAAVEDAADGAIRKNSPDCRTRQPAQVGSGRPELGSDGQRALRLPADRHDRPRWPRPASGGMSKDASDFVGRSGRFELPTHQSPREPSAATWVPTRVMCHLRCQSTEGLSPNLRLRLTPGLPGTHN